MNFMEILLARWPLSMRHMMGTSYPVIKESNIVVNLDEMSCHFQIDVTMFNDHGYLNNECTRTLNMDQVIDVAVSLLGPLHYFTESPEKITQEVIRKLKERGF